MHGFGVFVSGDEFEGVENVFLCFARDAEGLRAAEADADEDGVVIAFEILDGHIVANGNAAAEFYVGGTDEFDFAGGVVRSEFVLSDAVSVEAAGLGTFIEDGDVEAVFAEFGGTGERRGTGTDAGDLLRASSHFRRKLAAGSVEVLHGVALEEADGDGLMVDVLVDASAFTQDLDGADARATEAENVGIENGFGGAH